jgi:hypothetical protein
MLGGVDHTFGEGGGSFGGKQNGHKQFGAALLLIHFSRLQSKNYFKI